PLPIPPEVSRKEKEGRGDSTTDRTAALLPELTRRGIAEARARTILQRLRSDQPVMEQLLWADSTLKKSRSGSIRNPPGFYIYVLESNILPPAEAAPKARIMKAEPKSPDAALRTSYERYRQAEVERYIDEQIGKE